MERTIQKGIVSWHRKTIGSRTREVGDDIMGMDYQHAGSASYPRFDKELTDVARVFGGIPTKELKEKVTQGEKALKECGLALEYWFGATNLEEDRFVFPDGTDELLVKWFNHPYDFLTPEETKHVGNIILSHKEIYDLSLQMYSEWQDVIDCSDCWELH